MGPQINWLTLLCLLVIVSLCTSEYVPVYIWGSEGTAEPVPALQKLSENSFRADVLSQIENVDHIVIFAENSLSPEDFGQRDKTGKVAFPHLSKLAKTSQVTYLSNVQNPINAAKESWSDVAEISMERLNENEEIPDAKLIIIDLNDSTENERRFDLLKRHDGLIAKIYESLNEKYNGNVLALYTAHHASWIRSGVAHSRRTRAVIDEAPNQHMDNDTILYYTSQGVSIWTGTTNAVINVSYTAEASDTDIVLKSTTAGFTLELFFIKSDVGYWYMQNVTLAYNNQNLFKNTSSTIYAGLGFSYACNNQTFSNENISFIFTQFQVQPLFKKTLRSSVYQFDDPYNCVGFTTIPIWSGLFITVILLFIMTIGITMMMDIKTMDRFDDPKGKTITINTSE